MSLAERQQQFLEAVQGHFGTAGRVRPNKLFGVVADLVKKHAWHGKPLDPETMADELGDVLWYLADLATALDLTLEGIAFANIAKLRRRYPDGFTVGGGVR